MMKKNLIHAYLLPLLLAGMTGCTEDSILTETGKLPDEASITHTWGMLRSDKTQTNKVAVNLTEGDQSGTEAIYYALTQPAKQALTVTATADEKLVEAYNLANKTKLKPLPATNVSFEGGGTLTVAAGKQASGKIKVTIATNGLEPGTIYLLPLTVAEAPKEVQGQAEKQTLYCGVKIRKKITTVYPSDQYTPVDIPPLLPNSFVVFYVNTETYQPLLGDMFAVNKISNTDFSETLYTIGDVVNLKTVTVGYDKATRRALLSLSNDMRYVLGQADKYIRPLQDHGRKVCICIQGGAKGIGFCNMTDAQIADFVAQTKEVIEVYGLDGINLWDEGSSYGKEGMPPVNTTSYPKLIKALREALPGKLLTVVDKGEPTEYFYDAAKCGGIEVGTFIDYAWHGYNSQEEMIQIIEPWAADHPYSTNTRKPIAGLTPERYGSVNIPLYYMPRMPTDPLYEIINELAPKRVLKWKTSGRKKNDLIVYGFDLIANEQNKYESAIQNLLLYIDYLMENGTFWGNAPWPPYDEGFQSGEYWYWGTSLDWRMFQAYYKLYAKDW